MYGQFPQAPALWEVEAGGQAEDILRWGGVAGGERGAGLQERDF